MKILDGVIDELVVSEDTTLNGTVSGNVQVQADRTLILNGSILGNLIAWKGSKVEIHGSVIGSISHRSELKITGFVRGSITPYDAEEMKSGFIEAAETCGDESIKKRMLEMAENF